MTRLYTESHLLVPAAIPTVLSVGRLPLTRGDRCYLTADALPIIPARGGGVMAASRRRPFAISDRHTNGRRLLVTTAIATSPTIYGVTPAHAGGDSDGLISRPFAAYSPTPFTADAWRSLHGLDSLTVNGLGDRCYLTDGHRHACTNRYYRQHVCR